MYRILMIDEIKMHIYALSCNLTISQTGKCGPDGPGWSPSAPLASSYTTHWLIIIIMSSSGKS